MEFEEWIATMENCIVTQSRLLIKQWSFGFIESSPLTRSKIHEKLFWFHTRVLFSAPEGQLFYWSIMTAVDSIKCRCAHSGMAGQVDGFQNPGVCLQAFPSFLPHPLSALLLVPFFARSLTLVPRSLLLNRTETLATQAMNEDTYEISSIKRVSRCSRAKPRQRNVQRRCAAHAKLLLC